ncbi:MAG: hypothetical protein ACYC4S_12570 [Rhodoferax sp.]
MNHKVAVKQGILIHPVFRIAPWIAHHPRTVEHVNSRFDAQFIELIWGPHNVAAGELVGNGNARHWLENLKAQEAAAFVRAMSRARITKSV